MNWNKLLSAQRLEQKPKDIFDKDIERTQFQRDYDRIIFSSPFRRLQNKTQVFPLPGSVFVHNRLTHSLEVSTVGRSLGTLLSAKLKQMEEYKDNIFIDEIGNIIGAACLAHDLGNPAFGHSGEMAISQYFLDNEAIYRPKLNNQQWNDIIHFEGNANAFRILTHNFYGRPESQFTLTYSTLATLIKYPCTSLSAGDKSKVYLKKYGFFEPEESTFRKIADQLGMIELSGNPSIFYRHPLSFLLEAADDICYNVIDIEDAHRLNIFSLEKVYSLLLPLLGDDPKATKERMEKLIDDNDKVSLLRAKVIGILVTKCFNAFWENHEAIMAGKLDKDLKSCLDISTQNHLKIIEKESIKYIYNHKTVLEKEIAGYRIIGGLLEEFIPAVLSQNQNKHYNNKLLQLIPIQFTPTSTDDYSKILSMLDFLSGMTDLYAVELYRKIKGISFPEMS
ncbi:MAG: deoxyguanosinetriphosphate triphosphohydrolase [Bacteroidota bacterium]